MQNSTEYREPIINDISDSSPETSIIISRTPSPTPPLIAEMEELEALLAPVNQQAPERHVLPPLSDFSGNRAEY